MGRTAQLNDALIDALNAMALLRAAIAAASAEADRLGLAMDELLRDLPEEKHP